MSDYKLKDEVSKLGAKPKKFTFLKGSKGTEVVISSSAPTTDMLKPITTRIGQNHVETKGTCYKDEAGAIVFATKDLSKEAPIRQTFTKAELSIKLIFRAPKPGEERSDASESGESSESGEASTSDAQPKPVTTNAPVLQMPNRPPPQPPTRATPQQPGSVANTSGESASAQLRQRGGLITPPTGQGPQPTGNPGGPLPTTALPSTPNVQPPIQPMRPGQQPLQPPQRPAQQGQPTGQATGGAIRPNQPTSNDSTSGILRRRGGLITPPTNPGATTGSATTATPPRPNAATTNPAPARTLPPAGKTDMGSRFSKAKMDQIKADTNRGIFKGMGEFKEVYKGVEGLQSAEKKLKEAAKGQPLDAKSVAFLTSRYDALIANVDSYQDKFNDDGTAKAPNRKRKSTNDAKRDAKFAFSDETRAAAVEARVQLKHPAKAATLEALSTKNTTGGLTDGEERTFHQTRAELMMLARDNEPVEKAEGGTSDVKLLRNFDGSVAYVFKSVAGESDQMGLAKGAGTAQEILTSKVSEVLKKRCGFDSGFPKTTLATLPVGGGNGPGAPGALIEGISGEPFRDITGEDPYTEYGRKSMKNGPTGRPKPADEYERDQAWCKVQDEAAQAAGVTGADEADTFSNLVRKQEKEKAEAIPPATVQKILFMNLMSAGADIKWSNVMADGQEARPFDGGGNMLPGKALLDIAQVTKDSTQKGEKAGDIKPTFGYGLMDLPGGGRHKVADAKLDPTFVNQILSLDPAEVAADMKAEMAQLKAADPTFDGAVGDDNVEASVRSIEAMQAAINAKKDATTEEFLDTYNKMLIPWLTEVKDRG